MPTMLYHKMIVMLRVLLSTMLIIPVSLGCFQSGDSDTASSKDGAVTDLPVGWEGNTAYFQYEEGVVMAGDLSASIPRNEFLCTKASYSDFELTLEAKLEGEGQNAGIQFRSERIPDHHEVIGYQCDMGFMEGRAIWGSLYDESRRRKFLRHPPADSIASVLDPGDWNQIKIRAVDHHVQIWVNDFKTVDYHESDPAIKPSGIICLQIHSGPPAMASYRNIKITEL